MTPKTDGERRRLVLIDATGVAGPSTWGAQAPFERASTLVMPRRGTVGADGRMGPIELEREADALAATLIAGDHLVAHSYGSLLAIRAAGLRDDLASLTVIEPPAFQLAPDHPDVAAVWAETRDVWAVQEPRTFLIRFAALVGSQWEPPDPLPPEFESFACRFLGATPPWDVSLPMAAIRQRRLPVLVVSGGWHPAFEEVCRVLAEALGARRVIVRGGGHDPQTVGRTFNDALSVFIEDAENVRGMRPRR